jgi:hypothetical protein
VTLFVEKGDYKRREWKRFRCESCQIPQSESLSVLSVGCRSL